MPRRYNYGYEPPPRDWGGGAIVIFFLAIIVGAVVLGSGWLISNSFLSPDEAAATAVATTTALPQSAAAPAPTATALPPVPIATPLAVKLEVADWDIPNGHFFTQTNGQEPLATALGFAVTNEAGIPFWDEVRRLGGVPVLGYPLSQRFKWQGFETQVFQRVILQWNPDGFRIQAVNILDELHNQNKDEWLLDSYSVPKPLPVEFDQGRDFEEVKAARLTLLAYDPAIDAFYQSSSDATLLFGLPASQVTDMGSNFAVRLQRGVLQRWKTAQPWAKAGQVTAANVGQLAVEAGIMPPEPLQPRNATVLP